MGKKSIRAIAKPRNERLLPLNDIAQIGGEHERVKILRKPSQRTRTGSGRRIRPDRTESRCKCHWPMELGLRECGEGCSATAVRTSTLGGGVPRPLRRVLARARQSLLGRYLRGDWGPASARSVA